MPVPRPPGPRDRLFGLSLLRDMERDYLAFWRRAQRDHGDTIYLRVGKVDTYAFLHPDQIREVLVDKASSFIRYEHHMKVLSQMHGQSVLISEGAKWQQQRRMLLPSFSPKRFDAYARQMVEAAEGVLDGLPADTPVDFEHAMNMLAMDVVLRTMFGTRVEGDTRAIEAAVTDLSLIAYEEMFAVVRLPDWLPLPSLRHKRRAMALLMDLIGGQIAARRAGPPGQDDLLGMLLAARDDEGDGSTLSDVQVRDQLMTIFFAGHDTTASGLGWAGWLLASHPDIAARAAAEVDAVLGGRVPGYADVARLPFLGQCIKEVLRLFPPAPGVFMRRAAEDVQIGPWQVPKGALVSIVSVLPQRDPRWFPDPGRFDPDRFAPELARQVPRGAYFPFGTGPRVCIGNSFAAIEMTLVLAMLLQRFVLRPAPGQSEPGIRLQVTLRPAGGVRLVLSARAALAPVAAPAAAGCPFHAAG